MSPFFIIGNPRSGTTLLRMMINAHKKATVPPECGFALHLAAEFQKFLRYDGDTYKTFAHAVVGCRKFETWNVTENDLLEIMAGQQPKTYPELCAAVYTAYAKKQKKHPTVVGDKNNYYINHLNTLRTTFPDSKIIFIVRDGRDVACSYQDTMNRSLESTYRPNLPTGIQEIAKQWSSSCRTIESHSDEKSLLIRYEDLLRSPLQNINLAFEFLDLPPTNNALEYLRQQDEPPDFLEWKNRVRCHPDLSRIGRYKSDLSKTDIYKFETESERELIYFEYL